ncbi:MAG: hypothetical protein AAF639_47320 [Chloroflexota bacterium]
MIEFLQDTKYLFSGIIGGGAFSAFIITHNLHTYRHPEDLLTKHEDFWKMFNQDTPENRKKFVQQQKDIAQLWLVISIFPLSLCLLNVIALIVAFARRFIL